MRGGRGRVAATGLAPLLTSVLCACAALGRCPALDARGPSGGGLEKDGEERAAGTAELDPAALAALLGRATHGDPPALEELGALLSFEEMSDRFASLEPVSTPLCPDRGTEVVAGTDDGLELARLAVDSAGAVHAFVVRRVDGRPREVLHRARSADGWSEPRTVAVGEAEGSAIRMLHVLVDPRDRIHVVGVEQGPADVEAANLFWIGSTSGGGWTDTDRIEVRTRRPRQIDAIQDEGRVRVVYRSVREDRSEGLAIASHGADRGWALAQQAEDSRVDLAEPRFVQLGDRAFVLGSTTERASVWIELGRDGVLGNAEPFRAGRELTVGLARPLLLYSPAEPALLVPTRLDVLHAESPDDVRVVASLVLPPAGPAAAPSPLALAEDEAGEALAALALDGNVYLLRAEGDATAALPVAIAPLPEAQAREVRLEVGQGRLHILWVEWTPPPRGQDGGATLRYCEADTPSGGFEPFSRTLWKTRAGIGLAPSDRLRVSERLIAAARASQAEGQQGAAVRLLAAALHAAPTGGSTDAASAELQSLMRERPDIALPELRRYARRFPDLVDGAGRATPLGTLLRDAGMAARPPAPR